MNELKVNIYAVLSDCVETGIEYGWNRAHKHVDEPNEQMIKQCMNDGVMLMINEKFNFDNENSN